MAQNEMTDEQVKQGRCDLEMMRRQRLWPLGNKLPLKKSKEGDWPDLGLLLRDGEGYIFVPEDGYSLRPMMSQKRVGRDELLQTLVAEGWIVD